MLQCLKKPWNVGLNGLLVNLGGRTNIHLHIAGVEASQNLSARYSVHFDAQRPSLIRAAQQRRLEALVGPRMSAARPDA